MLRSALSADALSAIYSNHISLAVWRRDLAQSVRHYARHMTREFPNFALRVVESPDISGRSSGKKRCRFA